MNKAKQIKKPDERGVTSFVPAIPIQTCHESFLKSLKKPNKSALDEGNNDDNTLSVFMRVANMVLNSRPNFTFDDFWHDCRMYGLEYLKVKPLFDKWTAVLVQHGRLEIINGAYLDVVYCQPV